VAVDQHHAHRPDERAEPLQRHLDQARLDELAATFTAVNDPNLIATVHYYGYWPFSVNIAGGDRFDATAQQDLTGMFDRISTISWPAAFR